MAQLGERIEAREALPVRHFRRVHAAALALNLAQRVVVVWGTLELSRQLSM